MSEKKYMDPRIIKTRKAILEAFGELMLEKTFRKITIGDITERAIVNRATFYAHFENKEDLLNYGVRAKFEKGLVQWLPEEPIFNEENLHTLTYAIFKLVSGFLGGCPTATPDLPPAIPLLETHMQPMIQEILREWLRNTGIDNDMQLDVQTNMLSWSIFGTALRWAEDRNAQPLDEIVGQLMGTMMQGAGGLVPA